jgi:hypothetical protein
MKARTEWHTGDDSYRIVVAADHDALRHEPELMDGPCVLIRSESWGVVTDEISLSRREARDLISHLQEALALCPLCGEEP